MRSDRKRAGATTIVLALAVLLSACGAPAQGGTGTETLPKILGQEAEAGDRYTIYLGLNDKDTFEQKITTEEAIERANRIIADHAGGYTQFAATGGWTNDDGTMDHENSLVYVIYDIDEDKLRLLSDELLREFNQSSLLIEKSSVPHIYYTGAIK